MIPHSKPLLDKDEAQAATAVIARGEIALGPEIAQFEQAMAGLIGTQYAVATSNGTSAMHLALLALGVAKNDEVILPASVCPGVLHAIEYTGATPVICDCNEYDLNLSVEAARQALTQHTKAIILPHLFGIPSDIEAFQKLGVPLIEDCAQSLGARYDGKPLGQFGLMSVFSFYATKTITSSDGGMVLTNDAALAEKILDLRYYGGKRDYALRYNYKMQNLQAAIGLVQLGKLQQFLAERARQHALVAKSLQGIAGLRVLDTTESRAERTHHKLLLQCETEAARTLYLQSCEAAELSTGPAVFVNLQAFYRPSAPHSMPQVEHHLNHTYSFAIYPGIAPDAHAKFITAIQRTGQ